MRDVWPGKPGLARTRGGPPPPNDGASGRFAVSGGGKQRLDDRGNRRVSLQRRTAPIAELDPAFVEAVEHAYARHRVLCALRAEQRLPGIARPDLDPDRVTEDSGEALCQVVRRPPARAFELDPALACPVLLDQ